MKKAKEPLRLHMEIDNLIGIEKYGPLYMDLIKHQINAIRDEIRPNSVSRDSLEPVFKIKFLRENEELQEKIGALLSTSLHSDWGRTYRWMATVPEFVKNESAKRAIIGAIKESKQDVIEGVCQIPELHTRGDIIEAIVETVKLDWRVASYLKGVPELYFSAEVLKSLVYFLREEPANSIDVWLMTYEIPELMNDDFILDAVQGLNEDIQDVVAVRRRMKEE